MTDEHTPSPPRPPFPGLQPAADAFTLLSARLDMTEARFRGDFGRLTAEAARTNAAFGSLSDEQGRLNDELARVWEQIACVYEAIHSSQVATVTQVTTALARLESKIDALLAKRG